MRVNGRVRASAVLRKKYYKKLMSIVDEMNNSVSWWLVARYRENENVIIVQDKKYWSIAKRVSAERHLEARGLGGERLRSSPPVTKETVNPYYGREIPAWQDLGLDPEKIYKGYRVGSELKKGLNTFNGIPILNTGTGKPAGIVSAESL